MKTIQRLVTVVLFLGFIVWAVQERRSSEDRADQVYAVFKAEYPELYWEGVVCSLDECIVKYYTRLEIGPDTGEIPLGFGEMRYRCELGEGCLSEFANAGYRNWIRRRMHVAGVEVHAITCEPNHTCEGVGAKIRTGPIEERFAESYACRVKPQVTPASIETQVDCTPQ